jgi:hypothetical protein
MVLVTVLKLGAKISGTFLVSLEPVQLFALWGNGNYHIDKWFGGLGP